ncbi:class I SAM-dependent methyltransferase [Salmonella enterica subsp. enterica serovar Typhimurium]|nr:class I SAM-dependent methyltransferase [Salmonella enterica]EAY2765923.1 class I SAM-dependent methyltransferase [Salmonella enterica subsp. enterica serovar Typhimurium]EBV8543205.1 class I SAM-dependent methyltransferase [Salmonella enterica subsp. enterica serovar Typhimurium var. 5-]EDV3739830.1 class I SAM-dependent methyltransferase [Salmonella enterica subsp. enterica serovar Cerro]EEH4343988.1 class I SAM-dependent methyltransferase [Salmonella enterica subsp. enterica serovar 4,[5]
MPSSYLCDHIKNSIKNGRALDFGCGKLRYSEQLVNKFEAVTFLDSRKQLERVQIIRGVQTTIPEYVANNYKNANVVPFESIDKITSLYDFILCANVLSAIPCKSTIYKIISAIRELLKSDGEAMIVNQYKSSYFKKYESGIKHLHGYIYQNSRNASYYGLLDENTVSEICLDNKLAIIKSWSKAGSSYVVVGKK